MLRYINASNDIWFTDKNGRDTHGFIDFQDSDSVYRVLSDAAGADFADQFMSLYNDEVISDNDSYRNVVKYDFDELETIVGDTGSDVTDLRMLFNDLEELLGDVDDAINELVSRIEGKLDEIEEDFSTMNGSIYDYKEELDLLDR